MEKEILEKINKFTRREFSEDELYTFSVILCDNEIDRDGERFSESALRTLQKLFIGITGIFDHNASTSNQTARIYDTEIVTDESHTTKTNEPYQYLKGFAYMVRTDDNKNLIAEIDGGIKKEVSISCTASRKICSICGRDKIKNRCGHVNGKSYSNRICHTVLDGITDAYEWSFVAVPAQVNAGVTKKFMYSIGEKSASETEKQSENSLCRDIIREAFVRDGIRGAENVSEKMKNMNESELSILKRSYERIKGKGITVQLMPETENISSALQYKI
ncbi:MAG: hypothetical protein K2N49_03130 [Ruminococcus sp.]|nr:hypothetical protein [Ruminococcus sp.]MDE7225841.1 hypothetical protein [Ruminococcus sp.]